MRTKTNRDTRAFTVFEMMIAASIFTVLAAITCNSLFQLQRSSFFVAAWSDIRINQVRLMDSLEVDLRNAKTITSGFGGILVTMTGTPQLYQQYEEAGVRAGDAGPSSVAAALTATSTGAGLVAPNDLTVRYSSSIAGGVQTINRTVTWMEGGAQKSATREIATFGTDAEIVLVMGTNTATVSIRVQPRSAFLGSNMPSVSTITNTVFLRGKKFNS